jgi:HD-like signal output (HDOD) protein
MLSFRKAEPTPTLPDPSELTQAVADAAREACQDTQAIKRSLPDVAAEVMALCQQSFSDALRIEKSVTRDPFISAQIVSVANSPMFAPRMPIVSVRDAIVRIGLSNVNDIVMMVVTSSTMFRIRGFDDYVARVTARFPATALASRLLASEMAMEPVMNGVILDALHANHCKVGAAVCTVWKLPASTVEAAAHHHDYKLGGHHFSANLVAAADAFADAMGVGTSVKRILDPAERVFTDLGLKAEQVTSALAQFEKLLPSVRIHK